jgi:hypothetical protein
MPYAPAAPTLPTLPLPPQTQCCTPFNSYLHSSDSSYAMLSLSSSWRARTNSGAAAGRAQQHAVVAVATEHATAATLVQQLEEARSDWCNASLQLLQQSMQQLQHWCSSWRRRAATGATPPQQQHTSAMPPSGARRRSKLHCHKPLHRDISSARCVLGADGAWRRERHARNARCHAYTHPRMPRIVCDE